MSTPATVILERLSDAPAYPYTPNLEGVPPDRRILYANGINTYEMREDNTLIEGQNYMAHWVSPSLTQIGTGEELTLRTLGFSYSSEASSYFEVQFSGDGGDSWDERIRFSVDETGRDIKRIRRAVNTTGYDLRFRVLFPNAPVIKLFNFYPSLVIRGRTVL